MIALQQVDEPLRQSVLDEWAARCRGSTVRNPAGYLFGIIQKAIRGEFKAWAGQAGHENGPTTTLSPGDSPSVPSTREVAQRHIAQLKGKLRLR